MAAARSGPPSVSAVAYPSRTKSLSGRCLVRLWRHGDHDKDVEIRAGPRRCGRRATDDLRRRHATRRDADAPAAVGTARHRRGEEVLHVPDLVPGAHQEYAGQVHRHRRLAAPVVDDDVAASYLIAARPHKHLRLRRGYGLRLV